MKIPPKQNIPERGDKGRFLSKEEIEARAKKARLKPEPKYFGKASLHPDVFK